MVMVMVTAPRLHGRWVGGWVVRDGRTNNAGVADNDVPRLRYSAVDLCKLQGTHARGGAA